MATNEALSLRTLKDEIDLLSRVTIDSGGASVVPVAQRLLNAVNVNLQGDVTGTSTARFDGSADIVINTSISSGIPEAGTKVPYEDTENGTKGSSNKYAREDHSHPYPVKIKSFEITGSDDLNNYTDTCRLLINDTNLMIFNHPTLSYTADPLDDEQVIQQELIPDLITVSDRNTLINLDAHTNSNLTNGKYIFQNDIRKLYKIINSDLLDESISETADIFNEERVFLNTPNYEYEYLQIPTVETLPLITNGNIADATKVWVTGSNEIYLLVDRNKLCVDGVTPAPESAFVSYREVEKLKAFEPYSESADKFFDYTYYLYPSIIDVFKIGTFSIQRCSFIKANNVVTFERSFDGTTWSNWKEVCYLNDLGNLEITNSTSMADQLRFARDISLTGAATSNRASFDGTRDVAINVTTVNVGNEYVEGVLPYENGGTGNINGYARGVTSEVENVEIMNPFGSVASEPDLVRRNTNIRYYGNTIAAQIFEGTTFTGNSNSADRLSGSPKIGITGGVNAEQIVFDGSSDVNLIVNNIDGSAITGTISNAFYDGNANAATKLSTPFKLKFEGITANENMVDGSEDVTVTVSQIPSSLLTGMISTENLPKGALDILKTVEDENEMWHLTVDDVQNGDTVYCSSTESMYYVTDDSVLTPYSTTGEDQYDGEGNLILPALIEENIYQTVEENGEQVQVLITENTLDIRKTAFRPYTAKKATSSLEADKLAVPFEIALAGHVTGSVVTDGSSNVTIQTTTYRTIPLPALEDPQPADQDFVFTTDPETGIESFSGGIAVRGSENERFALADHVHPAQINIPGNSRTTDKLKSPIVFSISNGATGVSSNSDLSEGVDIVVTSLDATKLTGTAPVNTTGNAGSASKLDHNINLYLSGGATSNTLTFNAENSDYPIDVTSLDASKLTGTASVNTTGNAATATKLQTAKKIQLIGEIEGEAMFDGDPSTNEPTVIITTKSSTNSTIPTKDEMIAYIIALS